MEIVIVQCKYSSAERPSFRMKQLKQILSQNEWVRQNKSMQASVRSGPNSETGDKQSTLALNLVFIVKICVYVFVCLFALVAIYSN